MWLKKLGSFTHGWLQDAISNAVNVSTLLTHTFEIINWKFCMPKSWNNKIKLSQSDDISLVQEISFHMWEDNPTFFNVCSCLSPPPTSNCLLGKFNFGGQFGEDSSYSKHNIKTHFRYCSQSVSAQSMRGLPKSREHKAAASEVFVCCNDSHQNEVHHKIILYKTVKQPST